MADSLEKQERFSTVPLILVFCVSLTISTASGMLSSLIAKYSISLGASLTLAGTVSAIMSFSALAMRPFSGMISDRFNRKYLYAICTFGIMACVVGYSFSTSVSMLLGFRLIHGVFFSMTSVLCLAVASVYIPSDRLGEGLGYFTLASILATAVGPNIGLTLYDKFGAQVPIRTAIVMLFCSAVVVLLLPYPHQDTQNKRGAVRLRDMLEPSLLPLVIILAMFAFGNGIVSAYLPLLGDERGISNVGLYFTAYACTVFLTRPLSGKLLDRRGLGILVIPSIIMGTAAMCLLAVANSTAFVLAAGACSAIGQGTANATIQSASIKRLGKERAGVASSTCLLGQDIGNSFGPVLAGMAVTSYGYTTMFFGYAALLLVVSMVSYGVEAKRNK